MEQAIQEFKGKLNEFTTKYNAYLRLLGNLYIDKQTNTYYFPTESELLVVVLDEMLKPALSVASGPASKPLFQPMVAVMLLPNVKLWPLDVTFVIVEETTSVRLIT